MEVSPLSIILVKSDSKGDRLLFRYPFDTNENQETDDKARKNPYTLPIAEETLQSPIIAASSNITNGVLTGFSDEVLSSLFAVKTDLCNKKFELKVNDVRFVSHPTLLQLKTRQTEKDDSGIMLINIVFTLSALASHSVVRCYHDLSQRLGLILRHEEKRCGYVSEQIQIMMSTHDDCTTSSTSSAAFQVILEKCTLAQNIKKLYSDLCGSGLVNVRLNRWITLSFCLPQKAHQWHLGGQIVEPEDIDRCLQALRPYHSLLLLHPVEHLIDFTCLDSSPSLAKMLREYSPMKNLQTLSADSDLTLNHVFELAAHLVYWAKATIIFPVCGTNRYVISPTASLHHNSPLLNKFSKVFPDLSLIKVIQEFSVPTSLSSKLNPISKNNMESLLVRNIIWMLQHHLLLQLHTYIEYMPTDSGATASKTLKKFGKTPSPRTSSVLSASYPEPSIRTESESGASTLSEATEIFRNLNMENASFASTDDDKHDYQEELLLDFPDEERSQIFKIPATNMPEDLQLFARLCRKGYFEGNHHIEEIMYLENLRRSQITQLLDKFRDVLITYDTEDPAIAMFSCTN
ncbi:GATOR complex protein NPRL3 [Anthonomus grandis grandis]|uniref:GATOR complex protein NPRL3 n=1 Tax=Anthonomus grandis grandis TaxID=2921223 RepID=UPI002166638F|nr:GATOR complex protein NPRL3 [Anthonomus grandis grandis]